MLGPPTETASDNAPSSTAAAAGLAQLPGMRGGSRCRGWQSTLLQQGFEIRALMRSCLAWPLGVAFSELAAQGECTGELAAISLHLSALPLPKFPAKTPSRAPAKAQPAAPSKKPPPAKLE